MTLRSLIFTSLAAVTLSAAAHATTFGLAGSVGDTPTFTVTSNGITATFTGGAGSAYKVQNTAGLAGFNVGLVDNNTNFLPTSLTISFSQALSGTFYIPFEIQDAFGFDNATDSLTVMANTGQMATFAGMPDSLGLQDPEGIAAFTVTGPVTSITLTGTDPLAIGDISAVTPEPTSLALLATGMTGMAGMMMRRFRSR